MNEDLENFVRRLVHAPAEGHSTVVGTVNGRRVVAKVAAEPKARPTRRRWSASFAWYDLWVGAYWDRDCRVLYVCPLPCLLVSRRCGR